MRLFFALWPPELVAQALAARAGALAHRLGGKATRQETIHVTLAFLGEVGDAQLPAVIEAGRRVKAASFELVVDRLGYWRHNRLVWAGCSAVAPQLQALADALREQLRVAEIACDVSQRFVPHLTLVRKVRGVPSSAGLPAMEPLSWACGDFLLVRSLPSEAGSDYVAVAEFPCDGG